MDIAVILAAEWEREWFLEDQVLHPILGKPMVQWCRCSG